MKNTYLMISAILFFIFTTKLFFVFSEIRFSPLSRFFGPALVFFYLTYVMDVFLYFYYLKNTHLKHGFRDVLTTAIRCVLVGILFFHQIILESWYG